MRSLLDALDEPPALEGVLAELCAQREGIEENMGTVATLMRPPGDPFHDERLVAAYPQIRRFLPRSIEAVELQAIDSAAPLLAAYHALGKWLIDKPRTTRRPAEEVPLEVITAVVAVPRARPADRQRRPRRLHLLCTRPGPHPAAPPRHLRPSRPGAATGCG
jgi:hypothetical protein